MSLTRSARSGLAPRSAQRRETPVMVSEDTWVRNPCWIALPTITAADARVAGIYAVFPNDTYVGFTATGNFTVDWGDGTAPENIASGGDALHIFSYTDADLADTNGPVTFTASSDTVNRTAHGYQDGWRVQFWNIVTTTGLTEGGVYFVINATANTFQVATSKGGAAVALTNDGSGALLPYKQTLISITPNGGTLTSVNLNTKHTAVSGGLGGGWLDLLVGGKDFNTTGMTLGANSPTSYHTMLERFVSRSMGSKVNFSLFFGDCAMLRVVDLTVTNNITTTTQMFRRCAALVEAPMFNTGSVTAPDGMFLNCSSLRRVPLYNFVAATDPNSMFSGCSSLTEVPDFNFAVANNVAAMFLDCVSLKAAPRLRIPLATDISQMFMGCHSLTDVPLMDTTGVTNTSRMFQDCHALQEIPLFDTSSVTQMWSMFYNCFSLRTIPALNTAAALSMDSMFYFCSSLELLPPLNTASVTNMGDMFNTCERLKSIPLFNTAQVTDFSNMFSGCRSLREVPAMSASAATSSAGYSNMFAGTTARTRVKMTGHKFTFDVSGAHMNAAALDELYTALATVTAQTITVTSNPGTAADTPSIATGKGWSVTG